MWMTQQLLSCWPWACLPSARKDLRIQPVSSQARILSCSTQSGAILGVSLQPTGHCSQVRASSMPFFGCLFSVTIR